MSVTEAVEHPRPHRSGRARAASPPRRCHSHLAEPTTRGSTSHDQADRASGSSTAPSSSTTRWATAHFCSVTRIRRSCEAVREQVGHGTHYGAAHPLEVDWAELITSLVPSAEKVRFTASGTEAAMLALRVARAATGRDRIVKLDEHFHGWSDVVSPYLRLRRDRRGLHPECPRRSASSPPWCPPTIPRRLSRTRRDATSRPSSSSPQARTTAGSRSIRRSSARHAHACTATGTLLVFDEVVTGFRVAPGGMQSLLGITPDHQRARQGDGGRVARTAPWPAAPTSWICSSRRSPTPAPSTRTRSARQPGSQRSASSPTGFRSAPPTPTRPASSASGRARSHAAGIPGEIRRMSSILHVKLADPCRTGTDRERDCASKASIR